MEQITLEMRKKAGESLRYNESNGYFIYTTHDDKRATDIGLTQSRGIRGSEGQKVYFTNDPFAALPLWDVADERAREKLGKLKRELDFSYAKRSSKSYAAPNGKEYMPYQRAGIDYALARGHCLIGDEPGLGKTIQAVGIANEMDARRILVICPASIRLNWIREIHNWSTLRSVRTNAILSGRQSFDAGYNYNVISYELAKSPTFHELLCSEEFDLLILDEAHYLKTIDSQRTRSVFGGGVGRFRYNRLANSAEKIVALTGTPLPNRPRECYTLARGLCWESIDFLSYENFCRKYNPSGRFFSGHSWEHVGRLPELRARLRTNFMIRRSKVDVLTDLPDKRYEMAYVESNGAIREVLARERLIDFDPNDIAAGTFIIDGAIATLRREMGLAKIPRIKEHVRYLLDVLELPKIVIFAHHRDVITILADDLNPYGVLVRMGGMGTKRQQETVDEFARDPSKRIFIGQLDTMEGVDGLQHVAQYAVFAEPAWTPGRNEQCVDRLHRYGQHENVIAQFLIVEDSMDEKVLNAVLGKAHIIHQTLDGS